MGLGDDMAVTPSIISAAIVWNIVQADGRFIFRDQFVDNVGNVFTYDSMQPIGFDPNAFLVAHTTVALADSTQLQMQQAQTQGS